MSSKLNQLSLIAQFDDLMRMVESLLSEDLIDNQVKILLQNCERMRVLNNLEKEKFNELQVNYDEQAKKIRSLEITLKNVREAFKKELAGRERISSERDLFLKKLSQVQNYLQDDLLKDDQQSLKETILSSLNLHKLTTVIEENSNEKSDSLSGVEFDKTDEDVIDEPMTEVNDLIDVMDKPNFMDNNVGIFENEDQFDDFSMLNDTVTIPEDYAPINLNKNTPSTRSKASINSKRSALSESIMKKRQSKQLDELNVDNRPHQFVTKKVFRPEKCSPCGQSIGFMTSCYHCRDCRAICHMNCKDQVPLPCIPYVSRANIGKQGRLILISDYVQPNCKPCVPALIVHCTSEIERRGLKQIGLYRVSGLESEVRELKEKILKCKHGIPSLSTTDVHVLCSVVKKFLIQLDEALIIRISWRDFVETAKIEESDERRIRFKEAILNLPNANRDTLAFLILHLRRVAEFPENKMNTMNLSKVFGPTVLGNSIRDPPAGQAKEESKKQQQVVEYLLNLDDEFWQTILNLDNNLLNYSIAGSVADVSMVRFSPEQINKGRPSIGSRLFGGTVSSGTITPLRNKKSNRNFKMKPLF